MRDYIHVHDLARAHVLALAALADGGAGSRVYNLGCGGHGYSVQEVIETACRVTGREISARIGPPRRGDPAVLIASSERITRELGWRPSHETLHAIVSCHCRVRLALDEPPGPVSRREGAEWPGTPSGSSR
ncbi:MAG: NAD-dependent epimerase/dehydratase family protein [Candidatus Rokuibacteriota bacterium]